jgi:hypothetical protein
VGKCYTYNGVYRGYCTGGFEDEDQGRPTGGWDGTFINAEGEEKRSVFNKNEISNVKEIDCGSYPKTVLINRKLEVGKCYIYESDPPEYLGIHTKTTDPDARFGMPSEGWRALFEDNAAGKRFELTDRQIGYIRQTPCQSRPIAATAATAATAGLTPGTTKMERNIANVRDFIRILHSTGGKNSAGSETNAFRPSAGAGGGNSASGVTGSVRAKETIAVRTSGPPTVAPAAPTVATAAPTVATAATAATAATDALTLAETEIAELRSETDELKKNIGALKSEDKNLRENLTKKLSDKLKSLDEKINELCALNPPPSKSSSMCAPQGGRRYRKKTKMTKRKRQNRKKQRQSRRK